MIDTNTLIVMSALSAKFR